MFPFSSSGYMLTVGPNLVIFGSVISGSPCTAAKESEGHICIVPAIAKSTETIKTMDVDTVKDIGKL